MFFKLSRELIQSIQSKPKVLIGNFLSLAQSQRMSRPRGVLDLTPIDATLRQISDLLLLDARRRATHLLYKSPPHLLLGVLREVAEVERNVDARKEGLVEGLHAVGGEEEDAAVIFDVTKAK
jgi:hypothetical protein